MWGRGAVTFKDGPEVDPLASQIDLIVVDVWLLCVFLLKNKSFNHFLRTYNRLEHNILIFLFSTLNPKYFSILLQIIV